MVKHARGVTSVPRITLALGVSATLAAGLVAAPAGVGVTSPFISVVNAQEKDVTVESSTLVYKSGEDYFKKWEKGIPGNNKELVEAHNNMSNEGYIKATLKVPRGATPKDLKVDLQGMSVMSQGTLELKDRETKQVAARVILPKTDYSSFRVEFDPDVTQERTLELSVQVKIHPAQEDTIFGGTGEPNIQHFPRQYKISEGNDLIYTSQLVKNDRTTTHDGTIPDTFYNGAKDYNNIWEEDDKPSLDTGVAHRSYELYSGYSTVETVEKDGKKYAQIKNGAQAANNKHTTRFIITMDGNPEYTTGFPHNSGKLSEVADFVTVVTHKDGYFGKEAVGMKPQGEHATVDGAERERILNSVEYSVKTRKDGDKNTLEVLLSGIPDRYGININHGLISVDAKYIPGKEYAQDMNMTDTREESGFYTRKPTNSHPIKIDNHDGSAKLEYKRELSAVALVGGNPASTQETAQLVPNGVGRFTIKLTNTGEIGTRSVTVNFPSGLKDENGKTSKTFDFGNAGFPVGSNKPLELGNLSGVPKDPTKHVFTITSPHYPDTTAVAWTKAEQNIGVTYNPIVTNPGTSRTTNPKITDPDTGKPVAPPAGTTFTISDNPNWVTIDKDGTITATPPANQPKGRTNVTVTIKTPGGQTVTVQVPVTVDADYHVTGTAVDQNGNPVIKTNIADDGKLKEYTLKLPNGAKNITRDGDNIVIEWNDPSKPKTVIRYKDGGDKETTVRVTGTSKDRNVVFTVDGKDVTIPVADLYVEKVTRGADGNYTVTLNDTTKKWDINVGSDLATMKKKIEQEIDNLAADSSTIENTLRTEMARVYDEHTKERTNKLNEYITAVNKFGEEVKKKDKEFNVNADKTDKKLSTLEQCVNSPAIALPALVATVSTIAATVQSLGLPNVFTGQLDPFENNPEIQQARKFLNDNQQLIAAGLGVLGIIGVLLIPGLCNSGALGERMVNGDAAEKPDSTVLGSSDNTSRETETEEVKNDTDNADNADNADNGTNK